MRVFLAGVSCVGKTTIGKKLATLLGCPFFDLDVEIEAYFATPIERLRRRFLTPYSYRQETSKALRHLLVREGSGSVVIALPSSGLMDAYWRVVKNANGTIIVLEDTAENILARITFYDIDSKLIEKRLTDRERHHYLREIKGDMSYFRKSYQRATRAVNITGLGVEDAAEKVRRVLVECAPI